MSQIYNTLEPVFDAYADAIKQNKAAIDEVKADLDNLEPGLSETAKAALLACFENVGWNQGSGREYIDYLESALYPNLYPKITATINQTGEVFDTDDLSSIRQYLTVKYFETGQSTGTAITGYTLEGDLTIGASRVTIKYNGLRAVVSVTVTAFHNTPTFAIGAPYATTSLFEYTPNAIRACMNPIAVYLPPGTYSIEHSAGSNYYFSLAAVKYDKSQYNPDFSFTEGTEKEFMTSGMSYAWPAFADGTNGWQNTSKTFTVLDAYTKMYLNLKKGTAGTDHFTSADIAALNGNIVFRRVSE